MAIRTFRCLLRHLPEDLAALTYDYFVALSLFPHDLGASGNYELCEMLGSVGAMQEALEGACEEPYRHIIHLLLRQVDPTHDAFTMITERTDKEPVADIVNAFIDTNLSQSLEEDDWTAAMWVGYFEHDDSLILRAIDAGAYDIRMLMRSLEADNRYEFARTVQERSDERDRGHAQS